MDEALGLGPQHLSSYEVIYEEDTPLYAQLQAHEFSVDEDLACAMYDELLEQATAHGFVQYEVANFARDQRLPKLGPGQPLQADSSPMATANQSATAPFDPSSNGPFPSLACRHNLNYWRGGPFLGLGPSAASYMNGVRTKNWSNTPLYCQQLERGQRALETSDELAPLQRAGEIAAFGLRMTAGWPFVEFQRVTGFDLRQEWHDALDQLTAQGWGLQEPDRFRLTRQGLRFADTVAEMFLR